MVARYIFDSTRPPIKSQMVPPLKDVRLKLRGGPLEIPEGGGVKIPPKNFVQRKMPGKKIRASKQQSANSLEKKFLQRLHALKKILQIHETGKKIVPQKFYIPPPLGISNGPPLSRAPIKLRHM